MQRNPFRLVLIAITLTLAVPAALAQTAARFDEKGMLLRPENWREWVFTCRRNEPQPPGPSPQPTFFA